MHVINNFLLESELKTKSCREKYRNMNVQKSNIHIVKISHKILWANFHIIAHTYCKARWEGTSVCTYYNLVRWHQFALIIPSKRALIHTYNYVSGYHYLTHNDEGLEYV